MANGPSALGPYDPVLAGFVRTVTHPRIFERPTPIEKALVFVEALRPAPQGVSGTPGPRPFAPFTRLCREVET